MRQEDILILEGRALLWALKRKLRSTESLHKRHMFLVDNFGLTDDLPSEIHIVLYDIKKFKILNKSNYMVHPPFHEIHMQNYPHKILVRRGWSKKNDKHILE